MHVMHNIKKWADLLQKSCGVKTAIFLKYICPFFNITCKRVKLKVTLVLLDLSGKKLNEDAGNFFFIFLFFFFFLFCFFILIKNVTASVTLSKKAVFHDFEIQEDKGM